MLDILTIVHSFADTQTASRIRQTCRRLAVLITQPTLYIEPSYGISYEYRVDGKLHRLDGPARKSIYGGKSWYRGGIDHREYHPQYTRGYQRGYIVEGERHREVGPSIVYFDSEEWYLRGKLHRKISPIKTCLGWCWYTLDKIHRLDGPVYDDIYAIRGVVHSISSSTACGKWRVNNACIRS